MARVVWPFQGGQPCVHVELRNQLSGLAANRILLADTGAGSLLEEVDLVLSEEDKTRFARKYVGRIRSGGAIHGAFDAFTVTLAISGLGVVRRVNAMIVPATNLPDGFDGIATIRFLDSFTYGNFGGRAQFGLETSNSLP